MPPIAASGSADGVFSSTHADTRAELERTVLHAEVRFIEDDYHFLPDQPARVMTFPERPVPRAEG